MSDTIRIITNNVPRLIVDAYELSAKEREEFDYIDWPAIERGEDSATFVRYKGDLIDLGDLEGNWGGGGYHMPDAFEGWHAYRSDSFFSGVLIRFCEDQDYVVVGRYMA